MGATVLIHFKGIDTGGRAFGGLLTYPSGLGVPLHVHEREDEMFLVVSGQMDVTLGDRKLTLLAGQSAFLPHGWFIAALPAA